MMKTGIKLPSSGESEKFINVDVVELGSEGSAACGGRSDPSEWQRSTDAKEHRRRRQMSGTATGLFFENDLNK